MRAIKNSEAATREMSLWGTLSREKENRFRIRQAVYVHRDQWIWENLLYTHKISLSKKYVSEEQDFVLILIVLD